MAEKFKNINIKVINSPFACFSMLSYTSGLYYKTITIVIMMIVSEAPNCGVITYDRN
jgi:hypothetical protein